MQGNYKVITLQMFDYTVAKENSPKVFKEACRIISSSRPDYTAHPLLIDVDGSTIQVFEKGAKDIRVYDDYDIGAVFIISSERLEKEIAALTGNAE